MFGYLRFVLALMVVVSHTGISFFTLSPGVMAVVVFYILAGYVVSHVYSDIIPNAKYKIFHFYKDRLLRIFPLYIYVAMLTLLFITLSSYVETRYTLTALLGNALIIPLNYFMYADFTILQGAASPWWIIPPAWSLGTELQAYMLLALGIRYKFLNYLFMLFSLVVYMAANLSFLHPDYFGYRFIIGVYFIFAAGVAIQRAAVSMSQLRILVFLYVALLLMATIFLISDSWSYTYTRETLIGLLVGMPLVYVASKVKRKLPLNTLLGSLSYGVFLSHFLSFWILDYIGITKNQSYLYVLSVILLSTLISFIGILSVENRVNKLRKVK